MTGECSIDDCHAPVKARGWCNKHWERWSRYGDPLFTKRAFRLEIAGQRFGRLVACNRTSHREHGQVLWECKCDCGSTVNVRSGNLRSGNTQSCGCLQQESRAEASTRHGDARSGRHAVEYTAWWSMISRCKYPSTAAYPWYGGRGIKVCARWLGNDGYEHFLEDMGRRPSDGWSIDRIDPDGDYEPTNCRWLPMSENSRRASQPRA